MSVRGVEVIKRRNIILILFSVVLPEKHNFLTLLFIMLAENHTVLFRLFCCKVKVDKGTTIGILMILSYAKYLHSCH
jgi:hypothetical protein